MEACCERCRRPLAAGALRFRVHLHIFGDTGGVLPGGEESPWPEQTLAEAVEQASRLSERELMEGVAEQFRFVLCPPCRGALRQDPAGARTTAGPAGRALQ